MILFQGDVWWLLVGIIRLGFYVITFITDVVSGVRSDCCCSVTSGHGNNLRKVKKNTSYVVTRMVMKLIEIRLKLIISSSAFILFFFISGIDTLTAYYYLEISKWSYCLRHLVVSAIAIQWEVV